MFRFLLRMLAAGIISVALSGVAFADDVQVKQDYPDEYYVKPGDTLWDISAKFLKEPWLWPEIWHNNDSIENPHLIYPGDKISLRYVDGKPQLVVNSSDTVKLSPSVKSSDLTSPIPIIPLDKIQSFLREAWVLTADELDRSPYLLGGENKRVIYGQGDLVHVRDPENQWEELYNNYSIYRVGERYINEETNEVLGYEALKVGEGKVEKHSGDIMSLRVTKSDDALGAGDIVMPTPPRALQSIYYPSESEEEVEGRLIRFFDRLSSVARHDVVVVNKGEREGLREGNVLQTFHRGEVVRDKQRDEVVHLPDTKSGTMILFRVFEKVSFGLIMESYLPVYKDDIVKSHE